MIEIHLEILRKNNKDEFAVLPFEDYQKVLKYIEDLEDLVDLRKAKSETIDKPSFSLEETKLLLEI